MLQSRALRRIWASILCWISMLLMPGCYDSLESPSQAPVFPPTYIVPALDEMPGTPTPSPTYIPLDSGSCLPPCWQGITPGISTRADVDAWFARNPVLDQEQCRSLDDYPDGTVLLCDGFFFEFEEGSELVRYMIIPLPDDITLEQLIEEFGEPHYIQFLSGCLAEHPCMITRIFFPDSGLAVVTKYQDYIPLVEPNARPDSIEYWPIGQVPYPDVRVVPWQGYGDYADLLSD